MSSASVSGSWSTGFAAKLSEKLVMELAESTRDHAKNSMGGPGPNRPSEPGDAPHRQTSDLYEHVEAALTSPTSAETTSSRPSGPSEVPQWLEYGTPGGRMQARPYMNPAHATTVAEFDVHVATAVREASK